MINHPIRKPASAAWLVLALLPFLFSCSKQLAPQQGLVGEYLFKGNTADNTSFKNDGRTVGAPALAAGHTGKANSAYRFNGVDQFISIPHARQTNFEAGEDFSISLWVAPDVEQKDVAAGLNDILRKWRGDTQGYPFCIAYYNGTAHDSLRYRYSFVRYDGSICRNGPQLFTSASYQGGRFSHIVCTRQDGVMKLYVDSKLVAEQRDTTKPADQCGSHNNAPITIGTRGNKVRFFTGVVDDLRLYNRALTEEEIALLYKL